MQSPNGIDSNKYVYVVDGKQHLSCSSQNSMYQAKAYWDGETLVIEKEQQNGNNYPPLHNYWTSRYSLSSDGKVLAVNNQRGALPKDGFHSELIYDKQ